ncbi:MAG: cytochrome c biogenesis protein ResB, partial [Candidatus Nanopelagicales bacterium]|nr:cytochrome c biogenesis protein ResB [Candidatus Nanopelagicales bacterium]
MSDVTMEVTDDASATRIDPGESLPPLGTVGLLRWLWKQLTSMRTALILLFLLAVASIPGTVLPQRGTNPIKVNQYLADNPTFGPILDRLGFFDVFGSPWFSAVYLLLFISLIGCVIPRVRVHWRAMMAPPPAAPRNLQRMSFANDFVSDQSPKEALDVAQKSLRGWRIRRDGDASISAERGYLRETGNLVFHLALIVVLIG